MFNKKDGLLFAIILALAALLLRQEREKEALLLELDDVHDVLYEQKERVQELKHELSQVGFVDPVPYSARVIPSRLEVGGLSLENFVSLADNTNLRAISSSPERLYDIAWSFILHHMILSPESTGFIALNGQWIDSYLAGHIKNMMSKNGFLWTARDSWVQTLKVKVGAANTEINILTPAHKPDDLMIGKHYGYALIDIGLDVGDLIKSRICCSKSSKLQTLSLEVCSVDTGVII